MPQSRHQKRKERKPLKPTPYDDLVCFNFYRGWRAVQEFYSSAYPDTLNPQRSYIIGLCIDEAKRVSEIAEIIQIADAAVSNILRRMEKDNLIIRKKSLTDKRSIEVQATAHGAKLDRQTRQKLEALDEVLEQHVSEQDRQVLHKLVKVIHEHTR